MSSLLIKSAYLNIILRLELKVSIDILAAIVFSDETRTLSFYSKEEGYEILCKALEEKKLSQIEADIIKSQIDNCTLVKERDEGMDIVIEQARSLPNEFAEYVKERKLLEKYPEPFSKLIQYLMDESGGGMTIN